MAADRSLLAEGEGDQSDADNRHYEILINHCFVLKVSIVKHDKVFFALMAILLKGAFYRSGVGMPNGARKS